MIHVYTILYKLFAYFFFCLGNGCLILIYLLSSALYRFVGSVCLRLIHIAQQCVIGETKVSTLFARPAIQCSLILLFWVNDILPFGFNLNCTFAIEAQCNECECGNAKVH